ncbi:hypothetical protein J005_02392 [Cryptococcus neoformans]|nr:hypothetical protein C352_02396 [Cryptococcus neoformans var. grubii CHC193]OXH34966.1 hypothetical protein J005_02392 [Cryptococcus neoformans var. grubii]
MDWIVSFSRGDGPVPNHAPMPVLLASVKR